MKQIWNDSYHLPEHVIEYFAYRYTIWNSLLSGFLMFDANFRCGFDYSSLDLLSKYFSRKNACICYVCLNTWYFSAKYSIKCLKCRVELHQILYIFIYIFAKMKQKLEKNYNLFQEKSLFSFLEMSVFYTVFTGQIFIR